MSDDGDVNDDGSEASDDNPMDWQTMTSKRKTKTQLTNNNKKPKPSDQPSTSNNNRFSTLDNADDNNDKEEGPPPAPKPPPIYLPGISNISKMIKSVSSVISQNEFNYKSMNDGQVKLNLKSVDSYRKIVKYFDSNKISYHTYQLKTERAYRIVIKGLHHTTPTEDIKAVLLVNGHQVRYIVNVKSRLTKEPLSIFYVDLDPDPSNKKVFDIHDINGAIVTIEPPLRTSDIVQCHRCQQYGHTKSYCKKPFACVKCGLGHCTTSCTKKVEDPPRCVHCLQTHTANYKGCQIYQALLQKRVPINTTQHRPQFSYDSQHFPQVNPNYQGNNINFNNNNRAYSDILKQNTENNSNNNLMQNIEKLLNKQIELTTTLLNMMSLLMNKLCN